MQGQELRSEIHSPERPSNEGSKTAREWIQEAFVDRRRKNPGLSLRAFARFLRIPASRLSEVLAGKRPVTIKAGILVADRLAYPPQLRTQFLRAVSRDHQRSRARTSGRSVLPAAPPTDYLQLSADAYAAISDWYHYAILSLMETPGFVADPAWIAARLGISSTEASLAIARLTRLGLAEQTPSGFRRKEANVTTTSDVSSAALRQGHRQLLEKAIDALDEVEIDRRDISSMTMSIDVDRLPEAKALIKDFRRNLCAYLEQGKRTEVYGLSIQLIPLTQTELRKEKRK